MKTIVQRAFMAHCKVGSKDGAAVMRLSKESSRDAEQ